MVYGGTSTCEIAMQLAGLSSLQLYRVTGDEEGFMLRDGSMEKGSFLFFVLRF